MNLTLIQLASKALQNKHTTGAAVVYALAKWGCPLVSTWWPSHKAQLETTAGILEGAAVFYGFAAAGDASKSATKDDVAGVAQAAATAIKTGNTETLTRVPAATTVKPT